ncbi:MAG: glycosyltransferase [Actinomycetota bacterium]
MRAAKKPTVLIVAFYFPPAGGGGVQRPLKFAGQLLAEGFDVHVLAPDDPKWIDRDDRLSVPAGVTVHRARYLGPAGRRPAEELYGLPRGRRLLKRAGLTWRRLLVPDENVTWALTAIPAALRIVRRADVDVVITTSPPGSIHFVGAAAQALTRAAWFADLRDPLVAHPHRRVESPLVRLKEVGLRAVAYLVARRADAIIAVSQAIAQDVRARKPRGELVTIPSGADFDDFATLGYRRGSRFRVIHTGTFFGKRNPRPFLEALEQVADVEARFVGDSRAADRDWAETLECRNRVTWIPFTARDRTLRLQKQSEVLLLLIPDADGRGDGVLSGKVFEYLASGRPILAAVPPNGAAAGLIRETGAGVVVAPDDVDGIARELAALRDRWRAGDDLGVALTAEQRARLDRATRTGALASLLRRHVRVEPGTPAPARGVTAFPARDSREIERV